MTDLSDIVNIIGSQKDISGVQQWVAQGGASADPDYSQLAQLAPRTYATQVLPTLLQRGLQMQAITSALKPSNQSSQPSALAQYGSAGDQDPNAAVPQTIPGSALASISQPQQQNGGINPQEAIQAYLLGAGNIEQGRKAQQALVIPLGASAPPANMQYVNGRLQNIPGAAEAAGAQTQATKSAEETGTNLASAQKTLAIMQANLPVVMQRFKEMRTAAMGDPANGIPAASYGAGVDGLSEGSEGEGPLITYHNQRNDPTSVQNAVLRQRVAQGVLPEIGPQLAQAGVKGNKFLETLANTAEGIKLNDSPTAKAAAIDGLQEQYLNNLNSTQQQVQRLSGQVPTQSSAPTSALAQVSQPQANPALVAALKKRGLLQ